MLNVSKNGSEWSWSLVVLGTIGVDFKLRRLNLDGLKLALQWRQRLLWFSLSIPKGLVIFSYLFYSFLLSVPFHLQREDCQSARLGHGWATPL